MREWPGPYGMENTKETEGGQCVVRFFEKHARRAVAIGLGILCGMGLALYSPLSRLEMGGALLRGALGLGMGFVLAWDCYGHARGRSLRYAIGMGLAFGAACAAGCELQVYGAFRLEPLPLLTGLCCWLGLAALTMLWVLWIIRRGGAALRTMRRREEESGNCASERMSLRFFWLSLGILLLCWLPVWLANFPGLASHDIGTHLGQAISGQYTTAHSTLYTLIVKMVLWVSNSLHGGGTLFVALLCWFQMLLVGGSLAYAVAKMHHRGTPAAICVIVTLFFGLFPVFPIMTISTTKDVPFAAVALLFGVQLFELAQTAKGAVSWKRVTALCVTGICLALLRHNGTASAAILLLGAWVLIRGKRNGCEAARKKRWLMVLLTGVIAAMLVGSAAVDAALNAQSAFVTRRDMASVPCQQMARAMGAMPKDSPLYAEAAQFFKLPDIEKLYVPKLADRVKQNINVGQDAGRDTGWGGFLKTWAMVGLHEPKAYAEAFLELNRGIWFVHDTSHARVYPDHFHLGYLLTGQEDLNPEKLGGPIQYRSVFPRLQAFLYDLTSRNAFLSVPVLRMFFSVGVQCWLSVFLFLAACYRRDKALALAMGWMLSVMALLLFAPCVLVRYVFPIFLGNCLGVLGVCRKREWSGTEDAVLGK